MTAEEQLPARKQKWWNMFCSHEMHKECKEQADKKNLSFVEWVRQAMAEKLAGKK